MDAGRSMRERFLDSAGAPFPDPPEPWSRELGELLRIESISGDPARGGERRAAVECLAALGSAVAGEWMIREACGLSPLLVGRRRASAGRRPGGRPHVLLSGPADAQPAAPRDSWQSPPFEPTVREGWLHARGAADDKGNVYALVKGMLELAAAGRLPVDVTVLVDTDEETTGEAAIRQLDEDPTAYDAHLRRPDNGRLP